MAAQLDGQPPKNSHRGQGRARAENGAERGQTSGPARRLPAVRRAADDAADVVAPPHKPNPADGLAPPRPPRLAGAEPTKP